MRKQRHGGKGWLWASRLPIVGFGLSGLGLISAGVGLVRGFEDAAALVHVEDKATLLSNALSEALNCSGLFFLPEWLLIIVSAMVFVVGMAMGGRQPREADLRNIQ